MVALVFGDALIGRCRSSTADDARDPGPITRRARRAPPLQREAQGVGARGANARAPKHDRREPGRTASRSVPSRPMSKRKPAAPQDPTPEQKVLAKLRRQAAARLLKRRRSKSGQ